MYDGIISQVDYRTIGSIIAENISGNDLAVGTSSISSVEIGSGKILTANISGGQVNYSHMATNRVVTGSPIAGGCSVQSSTGTLGAGSDVWVAFPTAFKATPIVVAIPNDSTLHYIAIGSENVGSFYAVGATAAKTFAWIAVGSL